MIADTKLKLQLNKTYSESEMFELNIKFLNEKSRKYLTYRDERKIYFFEKVTKGFHLFDIVDQLRDVK